MNSFTCITLISCQTDNSVYITAPDGSAVDLYFEAELGNVVQITDPENFPDIYYTVDSMCSSFQMIPGSPCETCFSNAVTIDLTYITSTGSDDCPVNTAYVLVNCKAGNIVIDAPADLIQSASTALVTSSDLALYVGSVVNISEYPDNCYTVFGPYTEDTGCPCDYYTVTDAHKDCECCLPEVPAVFIRTTQKPVKKFYHITDSECDIRVNTKFANNYYKLFNTIKNGMGNCCDGVDLDKLWIEKELSDYSLINPPGECVSPVTEITTADCPTASIVACTPPTDVSGTGDFT
jgi:hypothetical protein